MKKTINLLALMIVAFISCKKEGIQKPESINASPISSNLTLAQKIDSIKAGRPPYDPRYSDSALTENYNGIAITGNSQMERWIYYTWDASWQGVPVINRGIGGTTWSSMYPHIQKTITDYQPKVIVLYQGENEYNGMNIRADSINKHYLQYFDEVRSRNPAAHIIVLSMLKIPLLMGKGLESDINKLNTYYAAKTTLDANASYVDITAAYPRSNKSLWRPDSIHINNYAPLLNILKPIAIAKLAENPPPPDTTTPPPPPPPPPGSPIARATAGDGTDTVSVPKSWNYNPFIYGTRSTDPDEWIAAFRWEYVSGPTSYTIVTPTAGKTRLDNLVVGTYVFKVTVTDNKGLQSSDPVTVIITNN